MLNCRMSLSYSEVADKWLEKKGEETGATKAGVIRSIILAAMVKDETKNGKMVRPKRN